MTPSLLREAFDRAAAEELSCLFTNLVDGLAAGTEADARAAFGRGIQTVRRAYEIAVAEAEEGEVR